MKTPLVSVVVPVYNTPDSLLKMCITSILNQTEKKIELILIDDGSTNNALAVCNSFSENNITIIHQENQGVSAARNIGISHSIGEWIMFVDPDDYLEKDAIATLIASTEQNDDVVQCSCKYIIDNKQVRTNLFPDNEIFFNEANKYFLFCELLSCPELNTLYHTKNSGWVSAPWAKIYRAKLLKDNNIKFNLALRRVQDLVFNLYVTMEAKQIHYINEALYVYNYNHLSYYTNQYNAKTYEYYIRFALARYDWLKYYDTKLSQKIKDLFYIGSFNTLLFVLNSGPLHFANKSPKKDIRIECDKTFNLQCFDLIREKYKCQIAISWITNIKHFLLKHRFWIILKVYNCLYKKIKKLFGK